MGNVVFWILFWLLVILAIAVNIRNARIGKQKRKAFLLDSYGKFDKCPKDSFDYKNSKGLYEFLSENNENTGFIDDITFFDLSLDQLFRGFNHTVSSPGEEYLYYKFKTLNQDCKAAEDERSLADYYQNHENVRNNTLLLLDGLSKLKKTDSFKVISELKNQKVENNALHFICDLLFVLSFIFIFVSPGPGFVAMLIMLAVNIGTYFSGKRKMEDGLYGFAYSMLMIETAQKLSAIDESGSFDKYKDLFSLSRGNFLISFKRGTTSNPFSIILDYLKLLFHFDLICYNSKLKKISDRSKELIDLYILIGKIDCAISVASFIKSQSEACYPQFGRFFDGFDIKGMIHPLNSQPVSNDIAVKRGIILTGSNASGKSTFLKTCGLNVIFAQNFGFALAKEYCGPIVRLYSSMSISDDITKRDSFFVAEAKSLKRICDATKEFDNVFCLIDEVLKGTNTLERISLSTQVLRYLANDRCICFAATHDGELSILLDGIYTPYYFTEVIKDGVMTFPYKIGKGVAGEGNAVKLLELLGYDSSITENAAKLCAKYKEKGRWE